MIPVEVADKGFDIAIYGQDPSTKGWLYWETSVAGKSGLEKGEYQGAVVNIYFP